MEGLGAAVGKLSRAELKERVRTYVDRWCPNRSWRLGEKFSRRPLVFVSFLDDGLSPTAYWLAEQITTLALNGSEPDLQTPVVYQACNLPPQRAHDASYPNQQILQSHSTNALVLLGHGHPCQSSLSSRRDGGTQFDWATIRDVVSRFNPRIVVLVTCSGMANERQSLVHSLLREYPHLQVYGCTEELKRDTCLSGPVGVFLSLLYGYLADCDKAVSLRLWFEGIDLTLRSNASFTSGLSEFGSLLFVAALSFHQNLDNRDHQAATLVLTTAAVCPNGSLEMIDTRVAALVEQVGPAVFSQLAEKTCIQVLRQLSSTQWNSTPSIKVNMDHNPQHYSLFQDASILTFTNSKEDQVVVRCLASAKVQSRAGQAPNAPSAQFTGATSAQGEEGSAAPMEFGRASAGGAAGVASSNASSNAEGKTPDTATLIRQGQEHEAAEDWEAALRFYMALRSAKIPEVNKRIAHCYARIGDKCSAAIYTSI